MVQKKNKNVKYDIKNRAQSFLQFIICTCIIKNIKIKYFNKIENIIICLSIVMV